MQFDNPFMTPAAAQAPIAAAPQVAPPMAPMGAQHAMPVGQPIPVAPPQAPLAPPPMGGMGQVPPGLLQMLAHIQQIMPERFAALMGGGAPRQQF